MEKKYALNGPVFQIKGTFYTVTGIPAADTKSSPHYEVLWRSGPEGYVRVCGVDTRSLKKAKRIMAEMKREGYSNVEMTAMVNPMCAID